MKLSIRYLDWFLILPLAASLAMIAEIDVPRANALEFTQLAKGALLVAVALIVSILVAAASAIDRRCTEEYAFQIMANAALVAMATTMLVHAGFTILGKAIDLPEVQSDNIVGIMLLGWVASYYWFRLRGFAQ